MARSFEHLRPETIEEAVAMNAVHSARAGFWAGGTDMMLLWNRRAIAIDVCIDLTYVPALRFIELDGEILRIGAMATLDDLDLKSDLNPVMAALGETARLMNTKQTRTIATVGDNMCHASPSADLTPPLVAAAAVMKLQGPQGERCVSLGEFHSGVNQTALADDEILTEIFVPDANDKLTVSYNRVARTVVDIALVSSAVCLKLDEGGKIERVGVALGAVAPTVLRVTGAEEILVGSSLSEAANGLAVKAGEQASATARAITDIRASKGYRTDMTAVLTRRAIRRCAEILGGAA